MQHEKQPIERIHDLELIIRRFLDVDDMEQALKASEKLARKSDTEPQPDPVQSELPKLEPGDIPPFAGK